MPLLKFTKGEIPNEEKKRGNTRKEWAHEVFRALPEDIRTKHPEVVDALEKLFEKYKPRMDFGSTEALHKHGIFPALVSFFTKTPEMLVGVRAVPETAAILTGIETIASPLVFGVLGENVASLFAKYSPKPSESQSAVVAGIQHVGQFIATGLEHKALAKTLGVDDPDMKRFSSMVSAKSVASDIDKKQMFKKGLYAYLVSETLKECGAYLDPKKESHLRLDSKDAFDVLTQIYDQMPGSDDFKKKFLEDSIKEVRDMLDEKYFEGMIKTAGIGAAKTVGSVAVALTPNPIVPLIALGAYTAWWDAQIVSRWAYRSRMKKKLVVPPGVKAKDVKEFLEENGNASFWAHMKTFLETASSKKEGVEGVKPEQARRILALFRRYGVQQKHFFWHEQYEKFVAELADVDGAFLCWAAIHEGNNMKGVNVNGDNPWKKAEGKTAEAKQKAAEGKREKSELFKQELNDLFSMRSWSERDFIRFREIIEANRSNLAFWQQLVHLVKRDLVRDPHHETIPLSSADRWSLHDVISALKNLGYIHEYEYADEEKLRNQESPEIVQFSSSDELKKELSTDLDELIDAFNAGETIGGAGSEYGGNDIFKILSYYILLRKNEGVLELLQPPELPEGEERPSGLLEKQSEWLTRTELLGFMSILAANTIDKAGGDPEKITQLNNWWKNVVLSATDAAEEYLRQKFANPQVKGININGHVLNLKEKSSHMPSFASVLESFKKLGIVTVDEERGNVVVGSMGALGIDKLKALRSAGNNESLIRSFHWFLRANGLYTGLPNTEEDVLGEKTQKDGAKEALISLGAIASLGVASKIASIQESVLDLKRKETELKQRMQGKAHDVFMRKIGALNQLVISLSRDAGEITGENLENVKERLIQLETDVNELNEFLNTLPHEASEGIGMIMEALNGKVDALLNAFDYAVYGFPMRVKEGAGAIRRVIRERHAKEAVARTLEQTESLRPIERITEQQEQEVVDVVAALLRSGKSEKDIHELATFVLNRTLLSGGRQFFTNIDVGTRSGTIVDIWGHKGDEAVLNEIGGTWLEAIANVIDPDIHVSDTFYVGDDLKERRGDRFVGGEFQLPDESGRIIRGEDSIRVARAAEYMSRNLDSWIEKARLKIQQSGNTHVSSRPVMRTQKPEPLAQEITLPSIALSGEKREQLIGLLTSYLVRDRDFSLVKSRLIGSLERTAKSGNMPIRNQDDAAYVLFNKLFNFLVPDEYKEFGDAVYENNANNQLLATFILGNIDEYLRLANEAKVASELQEVSIHPRLRDRTDIPESAIWDIPFKHDYASSHGFFVDKVRYIIYNGKLENIPSVLFRGSVGMMRAKQKGNVCEFTVRMENVSIPRFPTKISFVVSGKIAIAAGALGYVLDTLDDIRPPLVPKQFLKQQLVKQIEQNKEIILRALS